MIEVRRAKVVLLAEQLNAEGKLEAVQEVPIDLTEVNFNVTIDSLVERLKAQIDGQSEVAAAEGEDKEAE
jgi:hypothetical protein